MRTIFLLSLILFGLVGYSQSPVQNIRGIVIDRNSKQVLQNASLSVLDIDRAISAISDSSGKFILKNVPTGRVRIQCTYVGYQTYISDNIIINSAKEPELTIEMEDEKKEVEAVIVKTVRNPKLPVNRYALVSGRSFSPEETQRYAASVNDPSRMALAFPGVQATRDTRSDVIIRANNPLGMQWKLEGLDVINPNHFARKGSTGGGITILSLSMLDNSDFLTGAMPAEYGDVLSGVFDMHFRKGNNQKNEYTIKAGMIGLDFSTEGPMKKNQSSYLLNYRYSTLGLLHAIGLNLVGERESNSFQDLSFNLAFANKKNSVQWNFWGIGGYSKETYDAVKDTANWLQYDDYAIYDFTTKMGAVGIGNMTRLSERSFLQSSLAAIGQQIKYVDDTLTKQMQPSTVNDELYKNSRLSFTTSYNLKFSAAANLKTGIYISDIFYSLRQDELDFNTKVYQNVINGEGNSWLFQPYVQMSLKPGKKWTINPGLHLLHLTLNNKTEIDPRLSIQFRTNAKQSFSLAYGLHSKVLPLGSYFYFDANTNSYPNLQLDMIRSHHFIFAFDQLLGKGWRLHTESYYQKILKVPVVNDVNRTYWLLNDIDGYAKEALVSKGNGENIGVDISIEKFFTKGLFMIASFSVFDSKFEPLNGKKYNTRFNSGSSGSWTGAKEWSMKKNKVLQVGWKMIYNGGYWLTPVLTTGGTTREPVLDESRPYSEQVSPYFRTDLRLALRKDKSKVSWQLALDVQNIFGKENVDGLSRRYDPYQKQWVYDTQSGIVPVLSYQIDF